ncbi:MAG: hypothetical protein ACI3T9_01465 [Romboutsia timonensis]
MKINVKVDLSDCKFDTKTLHNRISEALEYGADNIKRTAIEIAPEDTGALKDSIHVTGKDWRFCVQPGTPPYDLYMEEGTRPHIITGNPWLYWDELDFPVHQVNHPGNPAYKYMEEAMNANVDGIVQLVKEALGEI